MKIQFHIASVFRIHVSVQRTFGLHFYFAGVAAGFAWGTGVCFSTWLAVVHSASFAALLLQVLRTIPFTSCVGNYQPVGSERNYFLGENGFLGESVFRPNFNDLPGAAK